MFDCMKTLSVQQPWASLICSGIKNVENRTWAPPMSAVGEKLLIHASGKSLQKSELACLPFEWRSALENAIRLGWIPGFEEWPKGCIIGYVDLTGFSKQTDSLWDGGEGQIKWLLENAFLLDSPIPMKGKLGVFETNLEVLPPAHKVIDMLPHRDGDTLILPHSDMFIDFEEEDEVAELDLTPENFDLLAIDTGEEYQAIPTKRLRFVSPTREVEWDVEATEVYIECFQDTGEPIIYNSLRGEECGKFRVAFYKKVNGNK